VLAVEKLMGIKPPERAEYIRVMMAELTRIVNHLVAIGFLLNDLGAFFTPLLYAFEERELILDVFEAVSGSRMMCNYYRFGGVARDLPEGTFEKIKDMVLERLPRKIDDLDTFLTNNEIVRARTTGVGVLTAEDAIAYSTCGPVLRASGVPYDVRRADPYSIYDRFDFGVCVRYRRYHDPLSDPAGRDAEHPHPGAGGEGHPGRSIQERQATVPGARPGGRVLWAGGRPQGRVGLLRDFQRQGQPLALSRARPIVHQPDGV
jgi:Ni,Fe-hydrogenase III large subunit